MSELTEQLRVLAAKMVQGRAGISAQWLTEAADAIERLTTEALDAQRDAADFMGRLQRLEAENARLRAALLTEVMISNQCGGQGDQCSGWDAVKCGCAGEARNAAGGEAGGEAPEPATKVLIADIIDPL